MTFVPLLLALGLALISLGCAIYGLVSAEADRRSPYIVWAVAMGVLIYGLFCAIAIACWRERMGEKNRADRRAEALERNDDVFRIHNAQVFHCRGRTPTDSTPSSGSTPCPTPRKKGTQRSHPGPLTSNPPHGPPTNFHSLPPLPHNLSDLASDIQTASTITLTTTAKPIQIPTRTRAATDAGHTAATAAASRTRANSLLQIREATARRISLAMPTPVTPPSATKGAFEFDS